MRRMLLVLALVLVAGGLLFWALDYHRGFILIAVGNHLVQISLWLALLALVAGWLGWRLVGVATRPARNAWRGHRQRRAARAQRAVMTALADYYEGRWESARTGLVRSARRAEIPGLNYVLAADAAARLGEDKAAAALLADAEREIPADSPALILARARLALRRREQDAALEILRVGQAKYPDHPQLLELLRAELEARQDWAGLALLLPALRKHGSGVADVAELETRVHAGRLGALAQPVAGALRSVRLKELADLWDQMPKPQRAAAACLRAHARALVALGETGRAERELRRHLDRDWDPGLALDWAAALGAGEWRSHLAAAERWLRDHGESWQLLLVLGRLCRQLDLRGKSREYLERALRLEPRAEVHAELGETLSASGDQAGAVRCFRMAARIGVPGPV